MRRGGGFHRRSVQKGMVYLSRYYRIARRNAPGRLISRTICAKGYGVSFTILQNRAKECNGTFFSPAACEKGMVGLSRCYRIARRSAPMWRVSPAACAKEVRQGFSPFIQKRPTFFCFPLHAKAPHFLLFSFPHKSAAPSFVPLSTQKRRVRFDPCAAGLL